MSKIRVLVVDDSGDSRRFPVRQVLERNGFEALEASDSTAGLRQAVVGGFDLILLDPGASGMAGLKVLDALRASRLDVPVVLMASYGSDALIVEGLRKGARDFVTKPFTAAEMLASIGRALAGMRNERGREAAVSRLAETNGRLEERVRELDELHRIGKSLMPLTARDDLLEQVVDAALSVTGAEEAAIFLTCGDGGQLEEHARKQRASPEKRERPERLEAQTAADHMREGDVVQTGTPFCAPLQVNGRAIGTLSVYNGVAARPLGIQGRQMLTSLADYAALAIENVRQLQQAQDAKEREMHHMRSLLERYVSPSIVERLVAWPDAATLGGVRRTVTALFADMRGFSAFSTLATPEVLVDVVNRHVSVVAQAILAEEGTLDKILGDEVLAYFNAPLRQPDHALRAVRGAWRICRTIEEANPQLPPASRLQFGVGVSTGEALVGNVGSEQLMSFTVSGDAVNVGRRLTERARAGQILICQQTYWRVQDHVKARRTGMVEIKGHQQPEPVFEVLSVNA